MSRKNFIKLIRTFNSKNSGLSIVEAVAAAFIVSIGFVSIYNLSSVITQQSINSIEREKATMLSNGMMEEYFEGGALTTSSASNSTDNITSTEEQACAQTKDFTSDAYKKNLIERRWCDKNQSSKGGIGSIQADGDIRRTTYRKITINNRNAWVITSQIFTKGGQAKKIIRKIVNE